MENTKRCPYCGEEILDIAKKCKYCKEWIEAESPKAPLAEQQQMAINPQPTPRPSQLQEPTPRPIQHPRPTTNSPKTSDTESEPRSFFSYYFFDIVFKHYADTKSLLSRKRYWMFYMLNSLASYFVASLVWLLVELVAPSTIASDSLTNFTLPSIIWCALMLIPNLCACVRRLKDANKSSLWLLLVFIPLGFLVVFAFTLLRGKAICAKIKIGVTEIVILTVMVVTIICAGLKFANGNYEGSDNEWSLEDEISQQSQLEAYNYPQEAYSAPSQVPENATGLSIDDIENVPADFKTFLNKFVSDTSFQEKCCTFKMQSHLTVDDFRPGLVTIDGSDYIQSFWVIDENSIGFSSLAPNSDYGLSGRFNRKGDLWMFSYTN